MTFFKTVLFQLWFFPNQSVWIGSLWPSPQSMPRLVLNVKIKKKKKFGTFWAIVTWKMQLNGRNWGSEPNVAPIWSIFDLWCFRVVLRLFGVGLKMPVVRKWLAVERSGVKCGTWGTVVTHYAGFILPYGGQGHLGSFGALSENGLFLKKTAGCREKLVQGWNVWLGDNSTVHLSSNGILTQKHLAVEWNGMKFGIPVKCI